MFAEGGYFAGSMHLLWWMFRLLVADGIVYHIWGRAAEDRRRSRESAHPSLRRRLASGDITAQEHEKRKALLDRDAPSRT
jgi:uncharacterized membrane protein